MLSDFSEYQFPIGKGKSAGRTETGQTWAYQFPIGKGKTEYITKSNDYLLSINSQ